MAQFGFCGLPAAIAAIAAEDSSPSPVSEVPDIVFTDEADDDKIALAGYGKTVKPADVNVPDAGQDVNNWLSQQGEELEGRKYNFIVDREQQIWWPNDSGGGFRGRWRPRVEHDPLGRRAGMRFPTFWRMFFLALAKMPL